LLSCKKKAEKRTKCWVTNHGGGGECEIERNLQHNNEERRSKESKKYVGKKAGVAGCGYEGGLEQKEKSGQGKRRQGGVKVQER